MGPIFLGTTSCSLAEKNAFARIKVREETMGDIRTVNIGRSLLATLYMQPFDYRSCSGRMEVSISCRIPTKLLRGAIRTHVSAAVLFVVWARHSGGRCVHSLSSEPLQRAFFGISSGCRGHYPTWEGDQRAKSSYCGLQLVLQPLMSSLSASICQPFIRFHLPPFLYMRKRPSRR